MKKKKWLKFRHRVVTEIARVILTPYILLRYRVKYTRFKEQGKRAYLVLLNHQTPFDQFFVGLCFKGPIYYLATEDLFSKGWLSSVIRWLIAPIPIKKQTLDISAVKTCIRVANEGGTIAIAPEGNRTYSGRTEYMNPSIASLVRKIGLPVVLFRIEGGYGVEPRWSDVIRRGKTRAYVHSVIEPTEYENLTNDELFERIERALYVDEAVADEHFYHKKRAEYLERAMYVCPYCGLSEFESRGCEIECLKCHRKITYGTDKTLTGVGFDFPFEFVADWYSYQKKFVNSLDVTSDTASPLYCDRSGLYEVIINERKVLLRKEAEISLYGDRIVIDEGLDDPIELLFTDISAISVLGRNKLNIYHGKRVFQLKSGKRFNALKYVNIYYRHKNIVRGEINAEFLGL